MQQTQQQAAYATQQHYFKEASRGPHAPSMPPHMLGPGGFSALHYLKQPGVMLTSLGSVGDAGGQLSADAHQYPGGMQELRSLPDVIQQQQQSQQLGGKQNKSPGGLGELVRGKKYEIS